MKEKVMKKIIVITISIIVSFFLLNLNAAETETSPKEWLQRIYKFYGQKQYLKALQATNQALKALGSSNELLQLKYNILITLKRYDRALAFIDEEIKKSGESEYLLSAKYNILFFKGNLTEALKVAIKKDKISKSKSPWDCMNIVHVYLRMGSKTDALDWLQEAVTRGFISYRLLQDKKYDLLKQEQRFYQIIETIKLSIGLGYPARLFKIKLLNGEDFVLANQRGKVVLIYFWATWCEPCIREMPLLNKLYHEFKDKGVEIVAISLDSDIKRTEEFASQNKLEWKHSCSGKVWKDDTVIRYGVNSLPSLWLVDKKGFLRSFDVKGDELAKVLNTLIAE